MTADEFLAIPPDGKRYELIDGEFITHSTPYVRHQAVLGNLFFRLGRYCNSDGVAEALLGPLDVVLSGDSVVEPDGMVIRKERWSIVGENYITGAPDIIVEIVSDETRKLDEFVKPKLYERLDVGEYWIVDPVIDVVKIYRRSGASFVRTVEISTESGGEITSPLLPGFALDVNLVFEA
jgi:Uma2 family endonuclease